LRTITPISFRDKVQREDSLNGDLPTIPLTVIQQSTDNFSELYKLGEGGFGPVYKVQKNWIYKPRNAFMTFLYNFDMVLFHFHSFSSGYFTRWHRSCCQKAFRNIRSRFGGVQK
jgi:hypothetical protein